MGMDADEDDDDPARNASPLERPAQDVRAQRAMTLYLQGRRVAEIAVELAVSETTVRRWTRQALAALATDEREARQSLLQRAIESQRAVASAAWEAYERERQLDEALMRGELDHVRRRAIRGRRFPGAAGAGSTRDDEESPCPPLAVEEYERPKRTTQGARYLAVALAAQREVARLQGLSGRLERQDERAVAITISRRPDGPENRAPAPSASNETGGAEVKEGQHDACGAE